MAISVVNAFAIIGAVRAVVLVNVGAVGATFIIVQTMPMSSCHRARWSIVVALIFLIGSGRRS